MTGTCDDSATYQPWLQRVLQRSLWTKPVIPPLVRRLLPQVFWNGNADRRQVALTFDDGPDRRDTLPLLHVLARQRVRATFCYVGERVAAERGLVSMAAAAGHQIGVHGYRHRAFVLDDPTALRTQLDATRDLIASITGRDPTTITTVRPPYGIITPAIARLLLNWGYRPLIGTIVPMHWAQPAQHTITQVLRYAEPGAVIVLHESLPGAAIAPITDEIITHLRTAGFAFVTIDEMRTAQPPQYPVGPPNVSDPVG